MLIVIDAVGIRGHGGEAVLTELLHWLPIIHPKWHWHVFLLERQLREFDDPKIANQVKIESTNSGNSGIERLRWVNNVLPRLLHTLKADILFSFANISPSPSRIPQIVFCHQPNVFFSEGIPIRALIKRARLWFMKHQILRGARASQAIIVQTHAMRERIEQVEPRLQGRIHVIPSGYRTSSPPTIIRPEKKALIDNASKPRMIYVSHPSEHKNHLALVRAMPGIVKAIPSASLLLTIDKKRPGDHRYSSFVRKIQEMIDSCAVNKQVVWLGLINPDEVEYAHRTCELAVFPSLAESFGLGLIEAMAAGCPIAAADLPYAHDVCANAAIYFEPKNPNHIAKTIINICQDQSELERLSNVNEDHIKQYSYERISKQIAAVMNQVLLNYKT